MFAAKEQWLDRDEYPFESHYFRLPAGEMHYVDEGNGPPVLMLHGNPTWSYLYRDLIKRLAPKYRCIAPDLLGFGLSDKPKDWSYLPEAHASNVASLIDGLGLDDITLVFQDWGGPIGLSWALSNHGKVSRLVVMNSWVWPVDRDPYYRIFSGIMGGPLGRLLIRRWNFFVRSVMRNAFGDPSKLDPATHSHYLRALDRPEDRTGCLVFPKQIVASTPWLAGLWGSMPLLRNKPVLIVWGMKDIAFREKELRRWQEAFPRAQTVCLEAVGHFVPEEAPDEFGDAVENFLAEAR